MTIEMEEKIIRPCFGKSSLQDWSSPKYFGIISASKQFTLFGSSADSCELIISEQLYFSVSFSLKIEKNPFLKSLDNDYVIKLYLCYERML